MAQKHKYYSSNGAKMTRMNKTELIIFANINKFKYSNIKFDYSLKCDNSLIVKADELILSDFSMIDSLSAYRIVNNENKYYVLLKSSYCSCLYFLEFGICKHFICLCKLLNYYSDDNVDQLNQTMKHFYYIYNDKLYSTWVRCTLVHGPKPEELKQLWTYWRRNDELCYLRHYEMAKIFCKSLLPFHTTSFILLCISILGLDFYFNDLGLN
ncbi:hypothetical protein BpHYR1_015008 [Brachionus plicatilis]|uniref:SWIM-type domain-containing protein n=1 Tax=Brachionus plicatilis TaxID=10195 RepID=A0A3M7T4T5_BRAPC|nr:hypothetical protein BpHYR1_015008 [Brachionus plicatilis]